MPSPGSCAGQTGVFVFTRNFAGETLIFVRRQLPLGGTPTPRPPRLFDPTVGQVAPRGFGPVFLRLGTTQALFLT